MHIYRIPKTLKCIIFDIDSTLYTNQEYAHEQVDIQIRHFATLKGMTPEVARKLIGNFRSEHEKTQGSKISLGNTLTHFGIPISESIRWREDLIDPAQFLTRDPALIKSLNTLAKHFTLAAVTNNPVIPATRTLEVLGVFFYFKTLIGLDTTGVSKPHERPFMLASEKTNIVPAHCLSVGDRYDIDIALPLELGMGGILVTGVEDVYALPELLINHILH